MTDLPDAARVAVAERRASRDRAEGVRAAGDAMNLERGTRKLRSIVLAGADLRYAPTWYANDDADVIFAALHARIPWQQHRLTLFGREVAAPRLSCWIGDADAIYTYSNTRFEPAPWTPMLARVRDDLAARLGIRFNSVLANLYRDGRDSMGWHSDDEPELGHAPVIASLSFGAPRTFRLRERTNPANALSIELGHGSLLLMAGATQARFRHALPKRARVNAPRINLTFRSIAGAAAT